jgi:tetratricopeptide (TPR) repeat protein
MEASLTGFIEFAKGIEGLMSAVGSLLLGITALITALKKKGKKEKHMKRYKIYSIISALILIFVSAVIFSVRATQTPLALNAELTEAAWDAYNKGNYEQAISTAQKCINEFKGSADREQNELASSKTPLPPKGSVSEEVKKSIWARGLLNDVATCYFIKGRSEEYLGRLDEAKKSYQEASKYTYSRCWDPKGWFWSPAEAAQDRLTILK